MKLFMRRISTAALFSALIVIGGVANANAQTRKLTVEPDPDWSEGFSENDHSFSCPITGRVLIGRAHQGGASGQTRYRCATLSDNGARVQITNQAWETVPREHRHVSIFAGERVLIGRAHDGNQENGTDYRTAKIMYPSGYVQLGGDWHTVTESDHAFTCPAGQILAGRYRWTADNNATVGYLCGTPWATSQRLSDPAGQIILRDASKFPCTLNIPRHTEGITEFPFSFLPEDRACLDNETESFELNAVPSQTTILMTDEGTCSRKGKWWIEVKTIKKSTTVPHEGIGLPELFNYAPGKVIRPGLILVGSHREPGVPDIAKSLSCVAVSTSPEAPPR